MAAVHQRVLRPPTETRVSRPLRGPEGELLRKTFRLSSQYFLSNALEGEDIGLEEVGDAVWNIVYYSTVLGRIDLQTGKITGSENV